MAHDGPDGCEAPFLVPGGGKTGNRESGDALNPQFAQPGGGGLVLRRECTEDGRGVLAELTQKGMAQLVEAAPTHLRGVRAHIVDLITPEEGEVLAKVFDRVMTHLRESNG